MAAHPDSALKNRILKELALLAILMFIGTTVLPVAVYFVGQAVFGEYGGSGFSDFFRDLHGEFRAGRPAAWLLLLSPYLIWQLVRATAWAVRRSGPHDVPNA